MTSNDPKAGSPRAARRSSNRPAQSSTALTEISDLDCRTRDGTLLRADVYRPSGPGRWPVLLCRTPYGKRSPVYVNAARAIAARGYVVAVQDVRGRYASEGHYAWMFGAAGNAINGDDGYDGVEWAAGLGGSDGRVGVWGNSYASALAWRLAGTRPPSLAAMFTSGMSARQTDMSFGIFETGRRLQWVFSMAADARRRAGDPFGPYEREKADEIWMSVERGKWLWRLPLASIPDEAFSTLSQQLRELYSDAHRDFWAFDRLHPEVNVPVSCLTGWWDRLGGTVHNYSGMIENGPSALRGRHRLIIGPWGHDSTRYNGQLGPRDYGPAAAASYPDLAVRFFDDELKGIDNGVDGQPVSIFVLNENRWRRSATWPLPGADVTPFFLSSRGGANTPRGDGILKPEPETSPADRYDYDPADPVMSLMTRDSHIGPYDQSPLDRRQDVLVYQTPPLEEDILVIGPVSCELWASSDAPDTDFTAKLVEVGADGVAVNLSYGILRASQRDGYDHVRLLDPGTVYRLTIPMMPIGIRFKKGSRIRLDISSSDFPNFDRSHNTGRDFWSDPETRVARQTIFHDLDHPSCVMLPIIRE